MWLVALSCTQIDLYEKSVAIPGHSWKSDFKPSFLFTIKDTVSPYQLFLILRHTDKYNYNNIYINLSAKLPGSDSVRIIRKDLVLGTDEKGWLGDGMDDIYESLIFSWTVAISQTDKQLPEMKPLWTLAEVKKMAEKCF